MLIGINISLKHNLATVKLTRKCVNLKSKQHIKCVNSFLKDNYNKYIYLLCCIS